MKAGGNEPAWLKDASAGIRKMYAYWDSKRAGRNMPARADIDPVEISEFLRFMILVDVVSDARRYVYRLVGTYEVEVRGRDPTGESVLEAYLGPSLEDAIGCYDRVVNTCAPHFDDAPYVVMDERLIDDETLFLPLSTNDQTVNMVLVFSTYKENQRR
jgi:hypothetical protein